MSQHTPGPWEQNGSCVEAPTEPLATYICGLGMDNGPDEGPANARLIAAAPELLEAAQNHLAALDDMTTEEFSRGADRPTRIALQAALAKATGGTP